MRGRRLNISSKKRGRKQKGGGCCKKSRKQNGGRLRNRMRSRKTKNQKGGFLLPLTIFSMLSPILKDGVTDLIKQI